MFAKNEELILNLFRKNIFLNATMREISILLKKAYPKIYDSLLNLESKKIIDMKKIGNSKVCSLSLNKESLSILAYLEEQEAFSVNIPNINKILEFNEFLDDIIIVTGSYAKSKQTKKSDIDLILIVKDKAFEKHKLMENLTMTESPEIHVNCFSYKDFLDMLLSKEENLGKEVFKYHLIFRNTERYYLLIKEAIKNGFRG